MTPTEVHVEPHTAYKWRVRLTGESRPRKISESKTECEATGRRIARALGVVFVLHSKTRRVESRQDYGFA